MLRIKVRVDDSNRDTEGRIHWRGGFACSAGRNLAAMALMSRLVSPAKSIVCRAHYIFTGGGGASGPNWRAQS
jgi:hypothetical protein